MYKFLDLAHELPDDHFDKEDLFNLSEELMAVQRLCTDDIETISELLEEKLLPGEKYHLMHEHMFHKGKITKYIGHVVIADKQHIIPFILNSLTANDLRPMRILPINSPAWLIRFSAETVMYTYGAI